MLTDVGLRKPGCGNDVDDAALTAREGSEDRETRRLSHGAKQPALERGIDNELDSHAESITDEECFWRGSNSIVGRPSSRELPPQPGAGGRTLIQAIPKVDPSAKTIGATIDRLRAALPAGTLVGGAVAENHDLEQTLKAKTPLVIGVVLALGFLLLLVALQAPVIAAVGVLTNLLATGAAFGVAKLVFQDGHGHSLLGLEPQGFLDAWGPVFFFAISMDYTVFLLSSAKEHWERSRDPREAMIGGLAHSGRVIFAAGAVMVAVFFTFALSGPLPPKEMGIILGIAVLLDALLVRLLLMPVMLRLLGRWAWYLPRPLGRLLPDVRFGHA